MATRKRILVAPLDWGLGHATRCVPLINALVENGCEVVMAGNGASLKLLQKRFPLLRTVALPGYNVSYSRSASQVLSTLFQMPRLLRVIAAEHSVVNDLVEKERFDGIISDNRYGIHHDSVPSVIVTHQLKLMMPRSMKMLEPAVMKMLHRYVNRFDQCWIPDASGEQNLSGVLSHNVELKIPKVFIGPLSRFENFAQRDVDYDLLVVLSGPEPQRTLLQQKIIKQLLPTNLKIALVEGTLTNEKQRSLRENFEVFGYADENELAQLIARSKNILARSGYSTVMDLCKLQRNALLIPTPGQTEQEYLAQHLSKQGWNKTATQQNLNVIKLLNETHPQNNFPQLDFHLYQSVIKNWLQSI